MQPHPVFISMGASLHQPTRCNRHKSGAQRHQQILPGAIAQLDQALEILAQIPGIFLQDHSGYYQTRAWGQQRAGSYLNAVVCLETLKLPSQLLSSLLQVEYQLARRRTRKRWGPRPIDLDLLLYANNHIKMPKLTIPHHWMWQRDFVLWPLAELGSYLNLPYQNKLQKTLLKLSGHKLTRPIKLTPRHTRVTQNSILLQRLQTNQCID